MNETTTTTEGTGTNGTTGTSTTTIHVAPTTTTTQPGTAPVAFTPEQQERVNVLIGQRLAEDRARRGEGKPAPEPKAPPAPPPGMIPVDEVERIIERNTAFERATGPANLTEAQRGRMLSALKAEKPENVAEWSQKYIADMGLGKQITVTSNPNGNAPDPAKSGAAAPTAPSGPVNPMNSGGLIDIFNLTAEQLDQLGPSGVREAYEKNIAVGQQRAGAPPRPKALQRK